MKIHYDLVILGAGASGLMCACEASKRGRRTLLLDHGPRAGRKILIAGGGKCNFTNMDVGPEHFISANPHFCKSAISRYSQWDFLSWVERGGIAWEERDHGRLFALGSAAEIRDLLEHEARNNGAVLKTGARLGRITRSPQGEFIIRVNEGHISSESLVVATGGLSYASIGASPLGYRIAEQFGLNILKPSSGLVPFTLRESDKEKLTALSGIAVPASVTAGNHTFTENLLFTHRGLSGPGILQASNYWEPGEDVIIDLLPDRTIEDLVDAARKSMDKGTLKSLLSRYLPKRLVTTIISEELGSRTMRSMTGSEVGRTTKIIHEWRIKPSGTEGYRTAEVTRGGVDTEELSSKTFESRHVPGLFFIGEVLDVTGQLGGYNLQWAWSSGWCAGQAA